MRCIQVGYKTLFDSYLCDINLLSFYNEIALIDYISTVLERRYGEILQFEIIKWY